jgi:hypothetical protein
MNQPELRRSSPPAIIATIESFTASQDDGLYVQSRTAAQRVRQTTLQLCRCAALQLSYVFPTT